MNHADCVFCKIIAGQIPAAKVYEDENVLAFLDIGPISEGHTLVLPKQHFSTVDQADPKALGILWSVMSKIAKAVMAAENADGYNILCNNGRAAGQVVDHVHFHLVPRKKSDGLFDKWPSFSYKSGRIDEILKQIRENL